MNPVLGKLKQNYPFCAVRRTIWLGDLRSRPDRLSPTRHALKAAQRPDYRAIASARIGKHSVTIPNTSLQDFSTFFLLKRSEEKKDETSLLPHFTLFTCAPKVKCLVIVKAVLALLVAIINAVDCRKNGDNRNQSSRSDWPSVQSPRSPERSPSSSIVPT